MGKKNPQLDKFDFVAIDFETAQYARESAVSVGLVKFIDGKEADIFYSLIRPPKLYIRPDFTAIHGLTVEDVKDAPLFSEIWAGGIVPFVGEAPLVAHNAEFDMGVLRSLLDWYTLDAPELRYFCSLKISRNAWRELRSHALTALGKHFGIVYDAHNALSDAQVCGAVINLAAQKYGSSTLRDLFQNTSVRFKKL